MKSLMSIVVLIHMASGAWAENGVQNPHFDNDLAQWSTGFWSVQWVGNEGFVNPGAAKSTATSSGGSIGAVALSQCLAVTGGLPYDIGGAFKEDPTSTQTGSARLRIAWHEVAGCASASSSVTDVDPVAGLPGWQVLEIFDAPAPPLALSASFLLIQAIDDSGDYIAFWDDLFFAPSGEIFSDGFESGNTSAWN